MSVSLHCKRRVEEFRLARCHDATIAAPEAFDFVEGFDSIQPHFCGGGVYTSLLAGMSVELAPCRLKLSS